MQQIMLLAQLFTKNSQDPTLFAGQRGYFVYLTLLTHCDSFSTLQTHARVNTLTHTLHLTIAHFAAFSFVLGLQSFLLQCLTGILLMTQYEPSARPAENVARRQIVMVEALRYSPTQSISELIFIEFDTAKRSPILPPDTLRLVGKIVTHPSTEQPLLPNAAYFSVEQAIMRGTDYGWLVRGIHQAAANILVASVLLAALCVCAMRIMTHNNNAQTSKQAALVCLSGVCVVASGITGYILPFDTRSFAALEIALSTLQSAPLLGNALAGILRGSSALGTSTLLKITTLHFIVLPSLIIACIWSVQQRKQREKFALKNFAIKNLEQVIIASVLVCMCVCWAGYATSLAPLLPADLTQPPLHTPNDIPAWYAYPAYVALKIFSANFVLGASIGAVLLCSTVFIIAAKFSIPSALQRSIDATLLALIAAWVMLSLWGIVQHLVLWQHSPFSIREEAQEVMIVSSILTLVNIALLLALKKKSA